MANITLQGRQIHTFGELPAVGSACPDFKLVAGDLSDVSLQDFAGRKKVLNIVSSLDTGICQASARRFNAEAGKRKNVAVLNISADLPFAQKRFCDAEQLANVVNLSTMRSPDFGQDFGVRIVDGPTAGLMSRAVLILDENNRILHAQQVPEIAQEPDYEAALAALG